jgi:hypothetical protein
VAEGKSTDHQAGEVDRKFSPEVRSTGMSINVGCLYIIYAREAEKILTNALTFCCTQAREISRTEKPHRAICEKSKRKPWRFFAASLWGLREPSFAEVTFKTGCAEGTILMPKQYPKRAPKRFSEPPTKSSVPDATKSFL